MTSSYSWAFDGVAGAALVALCGFLYQRYSARTTSKSEFLDISAEKESSIVAESPGSLILAAPVTDSPIAVGRNITQKLEVHHHHEGNIHFEDWTPTELTPSQILQEIRAALPFDREHVRENYKGLKVVWKTAFLSASSINPPNWHVITRFSHERDKFEFD